ncbi:MAG: phenylacetate--CoA ligase family protein [Candidatus Sumerlaeota bacterium]
MPIQDEKNECMERGALRQFQLERLQATLNRACRHVTFYHDLLDKAGLLPEDTASLEDLSRLPLTSRADLLGHQPYGLFAVPLHDVLRLHPAAGAGGPIVVGYTRNDLTLWSRMAARALSSAGVVSTDVVQITLDYGVDPAAFGAQQGAEMLGASVIASPNLSPERTAEVMRSYRATALVATPAQAMQLGRVMRDESLAESSLRVVLIVGEVWSEDLRSEIEAALGVEAFGSYGVSEMAVPGLATECEHRCGLHLAEDNVLAETIDPETGRPVAPGERGELVLTTLTREAVPLIRYRTGDLTILHDAKCECGRTTMRFEPTHARSDDIVIIGGIRVAPDQIDEIVQDLLPGAAWAMEVQRDDEGMEQLEIRLALGSTWVGNVIRDLEMHRDHVKLHARERLGVEPVVRIVESV